MPEITSISSSYSRKIQLEQFEPVQHSVTLEAEVAEGEDADEAYDELSEQAEEMVERQIARRVAQSKMQADEGEDDD